MTNKNILLIQRFYPNYREGLFDRLALIINFNLICHNKSYNKIIIPELLNEKSYIVNAISFRIYKDIILFPFLFFQLIKLNPKIIVTEGGRNTLNNIAVYIYSKIFNKDYIIWDLGKDYLRNKKKEFFLIKIYYFLQYIFLKRAKKIYTYNKINIPYFKSLLPNKEVVALGNTIDTDYILALKKKNIYYNDIPSKISGQKRIFLYVGALNEEKKVHELPLILKGIENYGLIIIGDGDPKYKYKLIKSLGGINYVLLGYKKIEELSYYFNISNLVILPGLGGLTIPLSYMFEVPVLCTLADGTEKEIIKNGINGFVFESFEEAQYFLTQTDNEKLKEMGRKGFQFVIETFSIEKYTKRFIDNLF